MINDKVTEDWVKAGNRMLQTWSDQSFSWMRSVVNEDKPTSLLPPHFDDLLGMTGKLTALMEAATELSRASLKYQSTLAPSYFEIWQGYMLSLQSSERAPATSFKQAMDDWLSYANNELVALANADEFLSQQNSFSIALTNYRQCQRDLMDTMLEKFDMPTQKEMEELGRRSAEMKREMRKLRKQLGALETRVTAQQTDDAPADSAATAPAASGPKPVRSTVHRLDTGYKPVDFPEVAP